MRAMLIGTVSALGLMATGANAATMNVVQTFSGGPSSVPLSGTFIVAPFNPALGTFLGGTFSFTYGVDAEGTVGNKDTASEPETFVVTLNGGGNVSGDIFSDSIFASDSYTTGSLAPGASESYTLSISDGSSGSVGPAGGTINYSLSGLVGVSSGSNFDLSATTTGFINGNVTYTYEGDSSEIPVPAALPLLATALGVFGAVRYRRKS